MRLYLSVTIVFLFSLCAAVTAGQKNSLYHRGEQKVQIASVHGGTVASNYDGNVATPVKGKISGYTIGGSNFTPARKANWFGVEEPSPRDFNVHDIITIVILEVSKHATKAETDAERESSIDTALDEFIHFNSGNLGAASMASGRPTIKASSSREFEGESEIKRTDSFSAQIAAKIIDVLPNGNLRLEATKMIGVDDETTTITLTGVCRSKDVINNTITSSRIAELNTKKTHTGIARDATKRSLLAKLLDFLNPF